jgi:MOSC domain-containing protein YiiM
MARIEGIFLAKYSSELMISVPEGRLLADQGLEGDRYCHGVGTYSVFRSSRLNPGQPEPGRQLTLISLDSIEAAFQRNNLPHPTSWGDLRRNIAIRGISAEELLNSMGHVVELGPECTIRIHRHTVPCIYNERKNGIPGMMESIWNEAGVSCQVLTGGIIRVGDHVKVTSQRAEIDDGIQSKGFYVPPSKRTSNMVNEHLERSKEQHKLFLETDLDGVERARRAYDSVGLTFWPREKN